MIQPSMPVLLSCICTPQRAFFRHSTTHLALIRTKRVQDLIRAPDLFLFGWKDNGSWKHSWPIPFQDLSPNRVRFADLSRAFRQRALPLRTSVKSGSTFAVSRGDLALQHVPTTIQACVFALDENQCTFLKPSKRTWPPSPATLQPPPAATADETKQWVRLGAVPKRTRFVV